MFQKYPHFLPDELVSPVSLSVSPHASLSSMPQHHTPDPPLALYAYTISSLMNLFSPTSLSSMPPPPNTPPPPTHTHHTPDPPMTLYAYTISSLMNLFSPASLSSIPPPNTTPQIHHWPCMHTQFLPWWTCFPPRPCPVCHPPPQPPTPPHTHTTP